MKKNYYMCVCVCVWVLVCMGLYVWVCMGAFVWVRLYVGIEMALTLVLCFFRSKRKCNEERLCDFQILQLPYWENGKFK